MTYKDPYALEDGPIARFVGKVIEYDGSLPSAIMDPRKRWKKGKKLNYSIPSRFSFVFSGEVINIDSDTDFVNNSKHDLKPNNKLDISITVNNLRLTEQIGYPHTRRRDQRYLSATYSEDIPISVLESLVGKPFNQFAELPPVIDEIMGWRKIIAATCEDSEITIRIDHQQWDMDYQPEINSGK